MVGTLRPPPRQEPETLGLRVSLQTGRPTLQATFQSSYTPPAILLWAQGPAPGSWPWLDLHPRAHTHFLTCCPLTPPQRGPWAARQCASGGSECRGPFPSPRSPRVCADLGAPVPYTFMPLPSHPPSRRRQRDLCPGIQPTGTRRPALSSRLPKRRWEVGPQLPQRETLTDPTGATPAGTSSLVGEQWPGPRRPPRLALRQLRTHVQCRETQDSLCTQPRICSHFKQKKETVQAALSISRIVAAANYSSAVAD